MSNAEQIRNKFFLKYYLDEMKIKRQSAAERLQEVNEKTSKIVSKALNEVQVIESNPFQSVLMN